MQREALPGANFANLHPLGPRADGSTQMRRTNSRLWARARYRRIGLRVRVRVRAKKELSRSAERPNPWPGAGRPLAGAGRRAQMIARHPAAQTSGAQCAKCTRQSGARPPPGPKLIGRQTESITLAPLGPTDSPPGHKAFIVVSLLCRPPPGRQRPPIQSSSLLTTPGRRRPARDLGDLRAHLANAYILYRPGYATHPTKRLANTNPQRPPNHKPTTTLRLSASLIAQYLCNSMEKLARPEVVILRYSL